VCGHVEVEEESPIDPTRSEIMEIDAKIIGAKMLKSKRKKKKKKEKKKKEKKKKSDLRAS
jgi:hypothetical protein